MRRLTTALLATTAVSLSGFIPSAKAADVGPIPWSMLNQQAGPASKSLVDQITIALGRAFDDPANPGHTRTPGGSYPIVYLDTGSGGPGYPTQPYPVCAADTLPYGWPSADASNFTNRVSWWFGSSYADQTAPDSCPNSKIINRATLDANFEHSQVTGNAGTNIDGNSKDANPGIIMNRFRSYPFGDPHDTTVVMADGLHLRAFCNGDPFATGCNGDGNTFTGIIRPEIGINDSDFAEACFSRPDVPWAWITNWFWRTKYPDPGTPYAGGKGYFYGQVPGSNPGSPYPIVPAGQPNNGSGGYNYYAGFISSAADEIDWPDGFRLNNDGVPATHDLFSVNATGSSYSGALNISPLFGTNAGGFTADHQEGNQWVYRTKTDLSLFNCYQVLIHHATWTDPSRNTIATHGSVSYYLNGQLYSKNQADIGHDYALGATGLTGDPYVPYAWMLAYQIPGGGLGRPASTASMTADGVAKSDAVVRSMKVWHYVGTGDGATPLLTNFVVPSGSGSSTPSAPTISVNASNQIVIVDTYSPVNAHKIFIGNTPGSQNQLDYYSGGQTYQLTGLTAGQTYYVYVVPQQWGRTPSEEGPASAVVSFVAH